jgi:6-phosphogluconolactonase (cycloisomerase 2 family)
MLKKVAALFLVCSGLALCLSCGKTASNYLYAAIPTSSVIDAFREDPNSGALTPLSSSPITAGPGVQSIVLHPSKQFLYAANSSSSDISLFLVSSTGGLTEVTRTSVMPLGTTPTLLVMDPAGSFLYVGNAESENISVFSIASTSGALTQVGSPVPMGMSPLNMALLPSGNFLFVTGQSGSQGYIEAFSVTAGNLSLVQVTTTGKTPDGLAIDPGGKYLYTADLGDNSISEFSIDTSSSTVLSELLGSPFGQSATYASPIWLLVDNSGEYLYVANQGTGNLSAYAIGSDGGLTLLTSSPFVTNAQPSVIASDPSGKYLFVGNQKSAAIESFSLTTSNGTLSEVGSYSVGNTPTSIVVLP